MNESVKLVHADHTGMEKTRWDQTFSREEAEKVRAFHRSFPDYRKTPLVKLTGLAEVLGVREVVVKDESYRFGLNAFKGLGGSYCIANYVAEKLQVPVEELDYQRLTSEEVKEKLGDVTFVTATDGNHGRGIAWTANRLGVKSKVFMPKGSSEERLENIRAFGSDASITDMNYDDTVRYAKRVAEENGWPLVQDTAWEGYEKIPVWIMKGYMTMALEAAEEYGTVPTHIFLQAGVGAMSGALTGFFADYYGKQKPIITIVEPNKADCIFRTAEAGDGRLHNVEGSLSTIMAGLACGEPCMIGWEELDAYADNFMSVPDYVAAKGMRILGNPTGNDGRVISGESGAAALGCAAEILQNESLEYIRRILKLDQNSRILCFSTEGDTDKENYRKIVWDGLYPSY